MSAPAPQPAATQAAAPAAAQASQQQAAAPATQQQSAPAAQQTQASAPATQQTRQRSSSPARLRLARGLATAAALLTGVVGTGTFDASGVNATPNVVAAQWQAAEQSGTELAAADLEVARTVARGSAGGDAGSPVDAGAAADAFTDRLDVAAEELSRSGVTTSAGVVGIAVAGDRAVRAAAEDPDAAAEAYAALSEQTGQALEVTDATAEDRADALRTGSRSVLTSVVGGVATLLLLGVMVWLALLTRRIVNVPLLLATAITAGLTYVSLNPAALPVDLDGQVTERAAAAQALQDVRVARAAQYAQVFDQGTADDAVAAATDALRPVEGRDLAAWGEVAAAQAEMASADGPAARLAAVEDVQEQFAAVEDQLADRTGSTDVATGTFASVTAGLALVLGLVAAGAAWTGLTRRLRDYR